MRQAPTAQSIGTTVHSSLSQLLDHSRPAWTDRRKVGKSKRGFGERKSEIKDFSAGYERDLDRSIKTLNEPEGEAPLPVLSTILQS
jgi:hypothetical protein